MQPRDKTSRQRDKSSPGKNDGVRNTPDQFDRARAESQSDYIVVCGTDGGILYVNPSFAGAAGYAAAEMTGTPLLTYIAEDFRKTMAANINALLRSSDPPFFETTLVARDGLTRSVIVKGRPVRFGDMPAALVFFIDITERKALEDLLTTRADELQQVSSAFRLANRKLSLLTSITRHDINNQLTVMKGYLGMLESMQTDPRLAGYSREALAAAERIAAMIRFTGEYEQVGITAPVWHDCRGLVDAAAGEAARGQVVLNNDLPPGREIYADPLVVKVIYNLIDNAVRHGHRTTTIRFSLQEQDGGVTIFCQDDGEGVPDADKERIFDRGFGKNTGLGLALSREILDITGITIQETGTAGTGARFAMVVPAECCRVANAGRGRV